MPIGQFSVKQRISEVVHVIKSALTDTMSTAVI